MRLWLWTIVFALFAVCGNAWACDGNEAFPRGLGVIAYAHFESISAETAECKYCGRTAPSAKALSSMGVCPNSPSKKHVALRGPKTRPYYVCRYCGFRAPNLRQLGAGPCPSNPNGKRHVAAN